MGPLQARRGLEVEVAVLTEARVLPTVREMAEEMSQGWFWDPVIWLCR